MTKLQMTLQQVKVLTYASMRARYRKTIIGFIWVVLNPILMYSVQAIVFTKFLQLNLPDYYLFLLGGLLPWIFINSSWDFCTSSIVTAGSILKSFQISPLTILFSSILENFINFFAAFIILVIPTLLFSDSLSSGMILFPISLALLILFTSFTTSIFSLMYVFYRDIKYITHFLMSILFFLTPIFYPPSFIPSQYKWIIDVNPLYMIIAPFRACLYNTPLPEILMMQLKGFGVVLVLGIIFTTYWKKCKNEILFKI